MEVQLKLFSEQMEYQREKDRRTYENASAANENARLAILKQGEMVNCLAQLSNVLSKGLNMSSSTVHGGGSGSGHQSFRGPATPMPPSHPNPGLYGSFPFRAQGNSTPDKAASPTCTSTSIAIPTAPTLEAQVTMEQHQGINNNTTEL